MRTPHEIYAAYTIMPTLQLHQLRVAAVAKLVCDNFKRPVNTRDVILACLFHDMGNVIKSDFSAFPDFCEPQGVAYWEGVKSTFIQKYGTNSHQANVAIAGEIGLPESVVALIDGIAYSKMASILEGSSYERKICEYADTRVGPRGVLSQQERMLEGKWRYEKRKKEEEDKVEPYYADSGFDTLLHLAHGVERQIFAETTMKPEDINDRMVAPLIEELWEYAVA